MVLDRVHRGLLVEGSVVAESEAGWVICRLAELLGWPIPTWASERLARHPSRRQS